MGAKAARQLGSRADIAFGAAGIAVVTAPTAAEVNALTRIEDQIAGSSTLETPRTGSGARIEGLSEIETAEVAGLITNGAITGSAFQHFTAGDATANDIFIVFDDSAVPATTQHLVVCRGGFSGASGVAAADDVVDVYTVQVSARNPIGPPQGEAQMFSFELRVSNVETNVQVVA
jgi:hypothetical protein